MLCKRIIPCFDVMNGTTVKGVNFENLREAGDPVELAQRYEREGADELVFLDITATLEERSTFTTLVREIARHISIPFTVGGGISSVDHVRKLLLQGADKVTINSAAVRRPELLNLLAKEFGSQCIVLSIDTKLQSDGSSAVYVKGGREKTDRDTLEWAREGVDRGAGELLVTSMDHDGVKNGFALTVTQLVSEAVPVPVIASGGAGKVEHFIEVFQQDAADAALAASVFHFDEIGIRALKTELSNSGVQVRV